MNIVVTGATSFIGVPMVEKLLKEGHEVYAVVRPHSVNRERLDELGHKVCLDEGDRAGSRLHVIELDLGNLDEISQRILVPCQQFYHFGWEGAGSNNRTNRAVQQENVSHSLKALEGAKSLKCSRFLFSGSQAEYGVCREAMTEKTSCQPVSEYGKAKVDFSQQAISLLKEWEESGQQFPSCIHARIFSVYGRGDHPWSLVESCLGAFQRGDYISLGECTQLWNFIYIWDLIEALYLLMGAELSANGSYGFYNVAGPAQETQVLRNYVRQMYSLCGCHGSYSYGRRQQNAEGPANLIPDITKLETETGWKPSVDFETGIKEMIYRD